MDSITIKQVELRTVKTGKQKWDITDTQGRYVTMWLDAWPGVQPQAGQTYEGELSSSQYNNRTYYTLNKPKAAGARGGGGAASGAALAKLDALAQDMKVLLTLVQQLVPRPGSAPVRVSHTPAPYDDTPPELTDNDLPF